MSTHEKTLIKFRPILVMQLRKSRIFLSRTWCSTWQWSAPPVLALWFHANYLLRYLQVGGFVKTHRTTDDHSSSRVSQRASSIANNIIRERFLYSSSTARLSKMQMFQIRFGKVWSWENDIAFVESMRQGQMYEESTFEEHLAPIVANASVMLDIGAHIGSQSLMSAHENPDLQIIAFEAQEKMFRSAPVQEPRRELATERRRTQCGGRARVPPERGHRELCGRPRCRVPRCRVWRWRAVQLRRHRTLRPERDRGCLRGANGNHRQLAASAGGLHQNRCGRLRASRAARRTGNH